MSQKAESATAAPAATREFMTFTLGEEEYGIDILKVQEVRGYDAVTAIANTPDFIKGVINLRGNIVPIVDLRIKFGLPRAEYGATTIVIVLHIARRMVGIVVDGVSDVIDLTDEQIRPAPTFSSTLDTDFVLGLGATKERMLILVDIEKLMSSSDMALMDAATQ